MSNIDPNSCTHNWEVKNRVLKRMICTECGALGYPASPSVRMGEIGESFHGKVKTFTCPGSAWKGPCGKVATRNPSPKRYLCENHFNKTKLADPEHDLEHIARQKEETERQNKKDFDILRATTQAALDG